MVILKKLLFDYETDYEKIVYTIHHEFRSIEARFEGLFRLCILPDNPLYEQWNLLFEDWRNDCLYLHYSYVNTDSDKMHREIIIDIQKLLSKNIATLEGLYALSFPVNDLSNEFFIYWTITRLESNRLLNELNDFNYYKKRN